MGRHTDGSRRRLGLKAALPAAALAALMAVGTTFAWQSYSLELTNRLTAHETEVEVIEPNFDASSGRKDVMFRNTGSSPVFLRVAYAEYWEKEDGGERQVLTNRLADGREIALKEWEDSWPESGAGPEASEWTYDSGDGWFYYNRILEPGETAGPVLEHVSFDEGLLDGGYREADYRLFFKAEAAQCSSGSDKKTLNRDEVNHDAAMALFRKAPSSIDYGTGEVTWPVGGADEGGEG